MGIRVLLAGLVAATTLSVAAQETYVLDPVHSQPMWEARHIGFSLQHGSFGKATGKVTLDRAAKKGSVDINIDAASMKTYDPRLDTVVKGERFLCVQSRLAYSAGGSPAGVKVRAP